MKSIGFCAIIVLVTIFRTTNGVNNGRCVCGEANMPNTGRIVGGVPTSPNKYPWMAAMYTSSHIFMCGGAIISDRTILSAGHCVFYLPSVLNTYWILGMHNQHQKDGDRYEVKHVDLHPKFVNHSIYDDYDISLVTLHTQIRFTDKIKPICLPDIYDDFIGRFAIIAGWGKLGEGKSARMGATLQESRIEVLQSKNCFSLTKQLVKYNQVSMVCGYFKNTDACQGDSGGPLFIETHPNRYVVFGTVSFGDGCARRMPGIYGRISDPDTLEWIDSIISMGGGNMCDNPFAENKQ